MGQASSSRPFCAVPSKACGFPGSLAEAAGDDPVVQLFAETCNEGSTVKDLALNQAKSKDVSLDISTEIDSAAVDRVLQGPELDLAVATAVLAEPLPTPSGNPKALAPEPEIANVEEAQGQQKGACAATQDPTPASKKTPQRKAGAKAATKAGAKASAKQAPKAKVTDAKPTAEDSEEDDLKGCPASKSDQAFEKELKKVKKQMASKKGGKAASSGQTTTGGEMNPWMNTEHSGYERKSKKEMFISFYREQYSRIKNSQPETKQYSVEAIGNLKIKSGHRAMPRPENVDLPPDFKESVGVLSVDQLRERGCESHRKLVCIHGDLFDVSDRPDKYGSDGPYWYMTGHDMTWGLITGDDAEEFMDKYYDAYKIQPVERADRKLQGLLSWWAFFEKEYGSPVGRLDVYEKEWSLPPPPAGELEDGCSIM